MGYYFGSRSKRRMQGGVNKNLINCVVKALEMSEFDMYIPWMGGFRKIEDQHEIYLRGASRCDGVLKKSRHQSGFALDVDVFPVTEDKQEKFEKCAKFNELMQYVWDSEGYNKSGTELIWGGNWKGFPDPVHWELKFI